MNVQGTIKVVGLGGSLADDSTSLSALKIGLQGAAAAGAEVQLFDIRELDLPLFDPDILDHPPESAQRLADAVYAAQGMLWSSPLYHGTVSGSFKNAVDWLDLLRNREPAFLTDKVIGLISTAGGIHGLQAVNTMEFCVRALRGWAVPLVMPIAKAWQAFDVNGQLRDPQIENQLLHLGSEVVRAARQFATNGYCDYSEEPVKKTGRG